VEQQREAERAQQPQGNRRQHEHERVAKGELEDVVVEELAEVAEGPELGRADQVVLVEREDEVIATRLNARA